MLYYVTLTMILKSLMNANPVSVIFSRKPGVYEIISGPPMGRNVNHYLILFQGLLTDAKKTRDLY